MFAANAKTFRAAPAVAPRRCVAAQANPIDKVKQDAKDSLKPRVEELREKNAEGVDDPNKLMTFSGPLPELVNGRLAMLGIATGIVAELYSGKTIIQQFQENPLIVIAGAVALLAASTVPLISGSNVVDDGQGEKAGGSFNFTTELINGRAAMLGIAIVLAFEGFTGHTLFN